MKNKYNLAPDLKKLSKFNPPFNRLLFPFANLFLSTFKIKSDNQIEVIEGRLYNRSKVKYYFIEPRNYEGKLPCLIYIHGGGFAFKAASYHYKLAKKYCLEANCFVVFVDYSLSPKNKFPSALNEILDLYKYIIEDASTMDIDINKIAIAGDSAGGNLAASLSNVIIDRNLHRPAFQMLIYPVLDATMKSDSMQKYFDTPVWNSKNNKKMWRYFLNKNENLYNPYISPIYYDKFESLPPSYIEVAEFDCLRDEAIEYASKLKEVTFYETKGTSHGFEVIKDSNALKEALQNRINFINKYFNR